MRHPLRSAIDLFRSKWWSIGWGVAAVAFALHVAALTLAPISIGQAVLAGGLIERIPAQRGVLLGIAAGLGFGISDVAIKALSTAGRSASSAPGPWSSSRRR